MVLNNARECGWENIPGHLGNCRLKSPSEFMRIDERRLYHHKGIDRIETLSMERYGIGHLSFRRVSCLRTPILVFKGVWICKASATARCIHHRSSFNKSVLNLPFQNGVFYRYLRDARGKIKKRKDCLLCTWTVLKWNKSIVNKMSGGAVRNKHPVVRSTRCW